MGLNDWKNPLTKIVNFLFSKRSDSQRSQILKSAESFKRLFDKDKVLVTQLDTILEIADNPDDSLLRDAAYALGFRGKYEVIKSSEISGLDQPKYDLCISSSPHRPRPLEAHYFLRV
jgi:hypothetical protein